MELHGFGPIDCDTIVAIFQSILGEHPRFWSKIDDFEDASPKMAP